MDMVGEKIRLRLLWFLFGLELRLWRVGSSFFFFFRRVLRGIVGIGRDVFLLRRGIRWNGWRVFREKARGWYLLGRVVEYCYDFI